MNKWGSGSDGTDDEQGELDEQFEQFEQGENSLTGRAGLEAQWLMITRQTLPALAKARRWPVTADHCFMRILLDTVHGGRWDNAVQGRPAYKHIGMPQLTAAITLAERVVAGEADLWTLNAQSLAWRGNKAKTQQTSGGGWRQGLPDA